MHVPRTDCRVCTRTRGSRRALSRDHAQPLTDAHPDYPLHARYELRSLYDADRVTYLYNLDAYDHVCIVTDAQNPDKGLDTLLAALERTGNRSVTVLEWR